MGSRQYQSRRGLSLTRRRFTQALAATAAAARSACRQRALCAATTVNFLGWQGYDDPVAFDDFLKSKDITLNTTYIGNNDEIVAKLRARRHRHRSTSSRPTWATSRCW